jgi:hypothetical protein
MSEFTADTIYALAREAGAGLSCVAEPLEHPWKFSQAELERFAALVAEKAAAREREALCDVDWTALMRQGGLVTWADAGELGDRVIEVLRARGEKEGA